MRLLPLLLCLGLATAADKNRPPVGKTGDELVSVTAKALVDKEEIKQTFGSDFGGFIVAVEVTVSPREGKKIDVRRDDFFLRSDKDGQKSQPFAPSQFAANTAMILTRGQTGGGTMGNSNGPVWGGMGGGMPGRLPGSGGGVGNGAANETVVEAKEQEKLADKSKDKDKDQGKPKDLVSFLKSKELPEGPVTEPVTGYLYFPLEGKQKLKDLELTYRSPAGKNTMRFVPSK